MIHDPVVHDIKIFTSRSVNFTLITLIQIPILWMLHWGHLGYGWKDSLMALPRVVWPINSNYQDGLLMILLAWIAFLHTIVFYLVILLFYRRAKNVIRVRGSRLNDDE